MWSRVKDLVPPFLAELEAQSQTAGLAQSALLELKKLVLKNSRNWGEVIIEEEHQKAIAADQLRSRLEAVKKEKAAVEGMLEESRRCIQELQQQSAHLASELSASKLRIAILEAENGPLAGKVAHSQERIVELQQAGNLLEAELRESKQKNVYLTKELEKWQSSATERALILEDIHQETWTRLGLRLGIVKHRDILPASSEMSLLPEKLVQPPPADEVHDAASKWELLAGNGCDAHLILPREDHQMVKVDITRARTRRKWDIQLNRRGFQVSAGIRYAVVFRGRAERPRPVTVGFAKAHEPWSSLGLYTTIQLSREWRTYSEEFVAAESDDNARIHFDLGGKSAGVDLTSVALHRVNSFEERPFPLTATMVEMTGDTDD